MPPYGSGMPPDVGRRALGVVGWGSPGEVPHVIMGAPITSGEPVNGVSAGQRLDVTFRHLPLVWRSFVWFTVK